MAIFQREGAEANPTSSAAQRRPAPTSGGQATVVAAGSRIKGEISGNTDVMIHGEVEGQLTLDSGVVVGNGGKVTGQIEAREVMVAGEVNGDIRARDRIEVQQSGRIEGDVVAPRVAINAGAFFKGKVEMTAKAPEQKSEPRPPAVPRPSVPAPTKAAGDAQ